MGESIEDKAEKAKSPGRKPGRKSLTKSEREDRDAALVVDRLRGRSWDWLSGKYDLSPRACQDAFEKWREHNNHAFENVDAISIVHTMLDTYVALQEEASEIRAEADADNNRLGAMNAQMQAMQRAAELMQATGILPKNLGTLRLEMDVRVLAAKLVRVFGEHDASPELKRAVLNVLEGEAGDLPVAGLPEHTD